MRFTTVVTYVFFPFNEKKNRYIKKIYRTSDDTVFMIEMHSIEIFFFNLCLDKSVGTQILEIIISEF